MNKIKIMTLLLLVFLLTTVGAVSAQTTTPTITSSPVCSVPSTYGTFDTNNWSINQQDNGSANFTTPNTTSLNCKVGDKNRCVVRVVSKSYLQGDFTISMDLTEYSTSYNKGQSFVFIMNLGAEKSPYSFRLGVHQNDKGKYIEFNPTLNNESFVSPKIFTLNDLNNITLSIEKKGSLMTGYFTQNGEKKTIASVNSYPANEGFAQFLVISNSPGSDPTTNYGSMKVNVENVKAVCTVPEVKPSLDTTASNELKNTPTVLPNNNQTILLVSFLGGIIAILFIVIFVLIQKNRRKNSQVSS